MSNVTASAHNEPCPAEHAASDLLRSCRGPAHLAGPHGADERRMKSTIVAVFGPRSAAVWMRCSVQRVNHCRVLTTARVYTTASRERGRLTAADETPGADEDERVAVPFRLAAREGSEPERQGLRRLRPLLPLAQPYWDDGRRAAGGRRRGRRRLETEPLGLGRESHLGQRLGCAAGHVALENADGHAERADAIRCRVDVACRIAVLAIHAHLAVVRLHARAGDLPLGVAVGLRRAAARDERR